MHNIIKVLIVLVCATFVTACGVTSGSTIAPLATQTTTSNQPLSDQTRRTPQEAHAIAIGTPAPTVNPCAGPDPGSSASPSPTGGPVATCHAKQRTDIPPLAPLTPAAQIPGLHPADIQSAYNLPSASNGDGQTIAIVLPFNSPTAAADLSVYRAKFGLPSCTTLTGCLRFVAQDGSAHLPGTKPGWTAETAIDLDMASAVCPKCKLLVVEANDDGMTDLFTALLEAVKLKPNVISNSWSIPESYSGQLMVSAFTHTGIAVVAGSGDSGFGVSWPAAEPSIIAVGGTTLVRSTTSRGWYEEGWRMAGYGCSTAFAKPSWQTQTPCTTRGVADIAAVADPATGVAIYDSAGQGKGPAAAQGGWEVYGGTSVATPIVAGAIALAGNASALSNAQYIYTHSNVLNQVVTGSSALQIGLGSPNGTAAL